MPHGIADSRIPIVHPAASMVVHVAGKHTPMRGKANFEQSGHPVFTVSLGSQILKFHTGGKTGGPFVKEVGNHSMRHANEEAAFKMVVFLQRVQKGQNRIGGRLAMAALLSRSATLVYFSIYFNPL